MLLHLSPDKSQKNILLSKLISNKQPYKLIRFISIHHIKSIVFKSFLFVCLSENHRERHNIPGTIVEVNKIKAYRLQKWRNRQFYEQEKFKQVILRRKPIQHISAQNDCHIFFRLVFTFGSLAKHNTQ